MATVTSNFSSLATMSSGYSTLMTTLSGALGEAAAYSQAAWDYANYYDAQTIYEQSSGRFYASLTNGDTVDLRGSGFLTSIWQASSMNYVFDATHSVLMSGSVTIYPNTTTDPTGSLTQIQYSGPQKTVTFLGYDNVSLFNDGYVTRATQVALNGSGATLGSVVYEGTLYPYVSIVNGYYSASFTGTITKATFTYGSQSLVISNVSWDVTTLPDTTSVVDALTWAMAGNDQVTGSSAADALFGFGGNDTLSGGLGADSLYGGMGDDTYTVDGQSDVVFEDTNQGTDTVISSASFYLYAGIEKLVLASGAGDIFGSANELDNTITGNEGGNLLLGWDGSDTISGGDGADILYGVNGADVLYGEAGIDVLVGGTANDTLDGGAVADLLAGEDGNDVLYGGTGFATDILVGGEGNDTLDGSASVASGQTRNEGDYDLMDGGAGNDTYNVDTPNDLTFEAAGGGTDTVIADISGAGYYLYAEVENLILQGSTPYGVGNELDNTLTGNAQSNWLLGGGGNDTLNGKEGWDVLFGESGSDTFVFERGTGGDVIGDFAVGVDKIKLVGIGYTNVAEVKTHMVEAGAVSALDLGAGDFVVLHNVTIASLSAGDFIFA